MKLKVKKVTKVLQMIVYVDRMYRLVYEINDRLNAKEVVV